MVFCGVECLIDRCNKFFSLLKDHCNRPFTDTAAILISIVSKDIMEGKLMCICPPGHPIIAIRNNRNQNGGRICKKVYLESKLTLSCLRGLPIDM